MPHQVEGSRWLRDRPAGMLAWDPRVGKTGAALDAWHMRAHEGRLLVLTRATARENWRREAMRWCPGAKAQVLGSSGNAQLIAPTTDIVITNYDKLQNTKIAQILRNNGGRGPWGAIILDEAHALKEPGAIRTRRFYGHKSNPAQTPLYTLAKRNWLLTGTPMPNHPAELYTHSRALWPQAIEYQGKTMERWQFELRYCVLQQTDYGMRVIGGKNLKELKERLTPYIHRRKFTDIFPEQTVIFETFALTSYSKRVPDLPDLVASLQHRFGNVGDIERFDSQTLDAYLRVINVEHDAIASIRRDTGTLKAIAVALMVREELEFASSKYILFAHHRDAIETLKKALEAFQPAVLHGGTTASARQIEIDRFRVDPACRVFIGQIQAAGEAIDLSAANEIVFVEAAWSPGANAQAAARASGPRQTNSVRVRFAHLSGSIDENVTRALARKTSMVQQVFG